MFRAATRSSSRLLSRTKQNGSSLQTFVASSEPLYPQNRQSPDSDLLFLRPRTLLLGASSISMSRPSARFFSSNSSESGEKSFDSTTEGFGTSVQDPSVDETLNKLFEENSKEATPSDPSWYSTPGVDSWEPSAWWHLPDQAIAFLMQVHDVTGLSYGWTIVATTFGFRMIMFPLLGMAQQTTSRMAHVQPELRQLQQKQERLGSLTREESLQFARQYKGLFQKYQVRPSFAVMPLIQLPVFMSMFFGLKKMPELFPEELSNAGLFWFPDLTIPDPTYVLPVISTLTLVSMFEVNKAQVLRQSPGQQGQLMLNVFRLMGLISFPVMLNFDACVVLMWATNSSFMLAQTLSFQTTAIRNVFGIWKPPKPVPGQAADPGIAGAIGNMVKRAQGEAVNDEEKIKRHNQRVDAKQSFRLAKARRSRTGITGKRNN